MTAAPVTNKEVRATPHRGVLGMMLLAFGCGRINFDEPSAGPTSDAAATGDAGCTFGAWSTPLPIDGANSTADEFDPTLGPDGLELFFSSDRNSGIFDLYRATRANAASPFGAATALAGVNSPEHDGGPTMGGDPTTLYMTSDRAGAGQRLYVATRPTPGAAFGAPALVGELSALEVRSPAISDDGTELLFNDSQPQLYRSLRSGGTFGAPMAASELSIGDAWVSLATDDLTLYLQHDQMGGTGNDLYITTRSTRSSSFAPPDQIPELSSAFDDDDPSISRDGRTLVFSSYRGGGADSQLYFSERPCQ